MTASMDAGVPARAALPIAGLAGDADYDHLPDRDLDQGELLQLASSIASRPDLWRKDVAFDDEHRHYVCLHRDTHVDVWMLCWTPSNDTGWHDHDISSGAVAVVQGRLLEHNLAVGAPSFETPIDEGQVFSFGPDHIHRLTGAPNGPRGTVSVHAYSPPLWRLGQYEVRASGLLRRTSVSYADELRPVDAPTAVDAVPVDAVPDTPAEVINSGRSRNIEDSALLITGEPGCR